MLESTPCNTKGNHVWKYHLIFFFCDFIIEFFCLGGALRKELLYERSRTGALPKEPLITTFVERFNTATVGNSYT